MTTTATVSYSDPTPYRRKTADILTATIRDIHRTLARGGCGPLYHRLDNECPREVKELFQTRNVQYQLVPPNDHCIPTQQSKPYAWLKTTWQLDGGPWTTNSRCPCGTKHCWLDDKERLMVF
jgi:hypothetical protein